MSSGSSPDTALRLDVRLDEYLFGDAAKKELRFGTAQEQAVRRLARTCNTHAQALVASEKEFFSTRGPTALHEFYQELEVALSALPEGAFLLNVGWGGGWEVKTLGDLLRTALGRKGFRSCGNNIAWAAVLTRRFPRPGASPVKAGPHNGPWAG